MIEAPSFQLEVDAATAIAHKAGAIMLRCLGGDQQASKKPDGTDLTIADTTINAMVIEELWRRFPEDTVLGEEASSVDRGGPRRWYCDPVDGTRGYTWGLPLAMFSLGLAVDEDAVAGVAYDPFFGPEGRLFRAERGVGSFCNNEPLEVSDLGLDAGKVAISGSTRTLVVDPPFHVIELLRRGTDVRGFPAGIVHKACLVAAGWLVGCVQAYAASHDVAAVQVIVEEAGGRITDWEGNELVYDQPFKQKRIIISNGVVHDDLVDLTRD